MKPCCSLSTDWRQKRLARVKPICNCSHRWFYCIGCYLNDSHSCIFSTFCKSKQVRVLRTPAPNLCADWTDFYSWVPLLWKQEHSWKRRLTFTITEVWLPHLSQRHLYSLLSQCRTVWLDSLLLCSFWLQVDTQMWSPHWESEKQVDKVGNRSPSLWLKPCYRGSLPLQKYAAVCQAHVVSLSVLNNQPSERATHAKEK